MGENGNQHSAHAAPRREVAVLAGGCFWGVEDILRDRWRRPITTTVEPASTWYSAEEYHQDYLRKHPGGYTCHYMR